MGKRIVQGLAKAVFAVVLAMTWVTGAGAQVISIHTCQTLTTFGATYRLTDDIFACGDCLIVAANRITIDLQGFGIVQEIGCFSGSGITDGGVAREQIVVKNGVTFRDAHEKAGAAVRAALELGCEVEDLPDAQRRKLLPELARMSAHELKAQLSVDACLARRNTLGGTSPERVRAEVEAWKKRLETWNNPL